MRPVDRVAAALGRFGGGSPVDLLVGEPCFDPPEVLRDALARAAREDSFGYGPAHGLPELRECLAALAREEGLRSQASEVAVTQGAKAGLLATLAALVEPGDEVIHPAPCYPATPFLVRRLGGVPVEVPEGADGLAGWGAAAAARIGDRTRAVVVATPSNPTGSVLPPEEAVTLHAACRRSGAVLVLDEAYRGFVFSRHRAPGVEGEGVLRLRSASKTWAVCGWRLGWVLATAEMADRVAAAHAALVNPAATPGQRALSAVAGVESSFAATARAEVHRRLTALRRAFAQAGLGCPEPAGGFYLWLEPRLSGATAVEAWCEQVAETRGVGLWPGSDFGAPDRVRAAVPRGAGWQDAVAAVATRLNAGL